MKSILTSFALAVLLVIQAPSKAHAVGKEFITSCTYGVIAGTIVGAATLAFADNPGDKLHRISRGASIGLYAGILLGAYVTYGVSGGDEEDYLEDEEDYALRIMKKKARENKLLIVPLVSDAGLDGMAAVYNVHSF